LTEERRKLRELEQEYRDLALSARAQTSQQQQAKANDNVQQDVSAMQRLAKCRTSLEESTETVRDLREEKKSLDSQVTRLQKELREAIADADEQERMAADCEKSKLSAKSSSHRSDSDGVPPPRPPPPPSEVD
jgi:septal ring factor EnvC (AmiA/AmiB activator)